MTSQIGVEDLTAAYIQQVWRKIEDKKRRRLINYIVYAPGLSAICFTFYFYKIALIAQQELEYIYGEVSWIVVASNEEKKVRK